MCIGEEYRIECQVEEAYRESCLAENIRNKLWRNIKGELIPIKSMSSSYLLNVLRLVQRPMNDLGAYVPIIEDELKRRAVQENCPVWDNGLFYK